MRNMAGYLRVKQSKQLGMRGGELETSIAGIGCDRSHETGPNRASKWEALGARTKARRQPWRQRRKPGKPGRMWGLAQFFLLF